MAVLVEAISVIVRRDSIDAKFLGGWEAFVDCVPNSTLCFDDEVARVGFMGPNDVESFVDDLERNGLQFLVDDRPIDLVVADQQQGLTTECDWLEFGKIGFGASGKVSACWFFDEPRVAAGMHMRGRSMHLATPPGWDYEDSLSSKFGFVATGQEDKRLRFLRHADGLDVFLDLETGQEVFVGRTSG